MTDKARWDKWSAELKAVALRDYGWDLTDVDAYRDYFDEGESPEDALREDMSYADE